MLEYSINRIIFREQFTTQKQAIFHHNYVDDCIIISRGVPT